MTNRTATVLGLVGWLLCGAAWLAMHHRLRRRLFEYTGLWWFRRSGFDLVRAYRERFGVDAWLWSLFAGIALVPAALAIAYLSKTS